MAFVSNFSSLLFIAKLCYMIVILSFSNAVAVVLLAAEQTEKLIIYMQSIRIRESEGRSNFCSIY